MASSFHEFDLIQWIREQCPSAKANLIGIGDDTAILQPPLNSELLFATDMLMEGTHFTFPPATPERAGRKALAVNISDLAAMAGQPHSALISLALPKSRGPEFAKAIMQGIIDLAKEFSIQLIGGDTNSWDGPLVINVAIIGIAPASKSIKRSGAIPGDWIFVTGELGGSLTGHHLNFTPLVSEALILNQAVAIHSMVDLSDGLASDLQHILRESNVGALLDATSIPISSRVSENESKQTRLQHALSDGEDFELLFTVSPEDGKQLLSQNPLPTKITQIGEITSRQTAFIQHPDGSQTSLEDSGWKHEL
ncbi:thiamine-phosphate kinase [Gimesia fumaroli]|uniref:Thiamine-monophosphate kinase n=1 Tax=Gimesia fumaroli TaxID=2527976 RepID=A0A518ICD5_9PLAN|nr:thiamine-phosphate kinase [Gimesia fumaroli]QDV50761.1 Thiamine-monophosphate kinase [Gimesia fumaroli]